MVASSDIRALYPEDRAAEQEIRLRELAVRETEARLMVELAKFGLQGTLTGALVGMVFILLLIAPRIWVAEYPLDGTHVCILTGLICTAVVAYGAFVYNRQLQIALRYMDREARLGIAGEDARDGKASRTREQEDIASGA